MKKIITSLSILFLAFATYAQITIVSQAVNPCGNDGQNEFLIASTGASGVNIADMAFGSANPASTATGCVAGDPDFNFWWAGTNVATNPFSITGLTGSCASQTVNNNSGAIESYGFLYPSIPANNTTINNIISSLNACLPSGCVVFQAVPTTNIVPPNSNFIVLLGAGICGLHTECTNLNFSTWCSGGTAIQTLYVVVGAGDGGASSTVSGGVCSMPGSGYFANNNARTQYSLIYNGGGNTTLSNYTVGSQAYNPGTNPSGSNAGLATPSPTPGSSTWIHNQGCIPAPAVLLLPINLTYFDAKMHNQASLLTWKTASETNNQYFAIERSTDNRTFYQIGKVDGTGTSQATNVYSFTDEQPLRGVNYYRLRQVDFDGVATYSEVKSLLFSEKGSEVTLYPNPVASSLTVVLDNASETHIRAAMYDAYGRLINICNIPAGTQVHTIDTNTLPKGTYTLVLNGELLQSTQRFTKQ